MNSRRLEWVWFLVWTSSCIGGLRAQCVDFAFPDPDLNLTSIVTAAENTKIDLTFQVRELNSGCIRKVKSFGVAVGKVDGATTLCNIEYDDGRFGVGGQYCAFASKPGEFRFIYTVTRYDDKQRLRWWTTNNIEALPKEITFNITYPPAITDFSLAGDPRLNVAEVPQGGERLVFNCKWNPGNPQSAGYIYHNTKESGKLELGRSELTGKSITYIYDSTQCSDTGIISCEVGDASVSKTLLVQCNNNSNTGTDEGSLSPTIISVVASVAAFVAVVVVVVVVNIACVRTATGTVNSTGGCKHKGVNVYVFHTPTGRCQPRRKLHPPENTLDVTPHRQRQQLPAVPFNPIPRPGHRDPGLRTAHALSNQSESPYLEILEDNSGIYTEPYPDKPNTFLTGPPGTAYLTPTPNQRSRDQNQPTARPADQNLLDHSQPIAGTAGLHPREQNQLIPRPPRDITKPIVSPCSVLDGVRETSTNEATGRGPHAVTYTPLMLPQLRMPSVYTAFKTKHSGDGLNEETTPKGLAGRPANSLDEETTLKCLAWRPGNALDEETMPKFVTGY